MLDKMLTQDGLAGRGGERAAAVVLERKSGKEILGILTAGSFVVSFLLCGWSVAQAKPTWTLVYSNVNSDNMFYDLDAVDGQHAWVVGVDSSSGSSTSVGFRTTSGDTFSQMMLPQIATGQLELGLFTAVAFADQQKGWLHGIKVSLTGEQPYLFQSTDGGGSWTQVFTPSESLVRITALPGGQFFGVGSTMLVLSTDGISYNEIQPTLPASTSPVDLFMLNPDCGYLLASSDPESGSPSSAVLWSPDGGQSWEIRSQNLSYRIVSTWFVTANLGWAAGYGIDAGEKLGLVVRTTDGGRTWTESTLPDHPGEMGGDPTPATECLKVRFFDDLRGVALCISCTGGCGDGEDPTYVTMLLRTDDGGTLWEMDPDYEPVMNAPPFGAMAKYSGMFVMDFPDPNNGFMAGENELVLRYRAAQQEAEGWPTPDCSGSNSNNSNTNGNNTNTNGNHGSGEGSSLSGCGCLVNGFAQTHPAWLFLCACLLFLVFRLRRKG